jgi:hypothetical protein
VLPAAPSAASSSHNIDFDEFESRKTADVELELRVEPLDRFKNSLPLATGYAVTIDDGDPTPLLPPSFSYTHKIPSGYSGALHLNFALDGTPIANSPVTINVAPDWSIVYVGVGSGALLFVGLFVFLVRRKLHKKKLMNLGQRLESVRVQASEEKEELRQGQDDLRKEKEELEEEVRRKKHSEEELKVMVDALQSVSKERQDELREVMIESKDIKVEKLLGKGG